MSLDVPLNRFPSWMFCTVPSPKEVEIPLLPCPPRRAFSTTERACALGADAAAPTRNADQLGLTSRKSTFLHPGKPGPMTAAYPPFRSKHGADVNAQTFRLLLPITTAARNEWGTVPLSWPSYATAVPDSHSHLTPFFQHNSLSAKAGDS